MWNLSLILLHCDKVFLGCINYYIESFHLCISLSFSFTLCFLPPPTFSLSLYIYLYVYKCASLFFPLHCNYQWDSSPLSPSSSPHPLHSFNIIFNLFSFSLSGGIHSLFHFLCSILTIVTIFSPDPSSSFSNINKFPLSIFFSFVCALLLSFVLCYEWIRMKRDMNEDGKNSISIKHWQWLMV